MISFTVEDLREVAPLLDRVSSEAKRPVTLPGLLERWEKFLSEVEHGYALTGYDYVDELATRDVLEQVVHAASPDLRKRLEREALASLDQRFRLATRELSAPLRFAPSESHEWWWRRAPLDLSGELAADLLAPD